MNKLVYVIDDDPVYRKFMECHFATLPGYTVRSFSRGSEAMLQLREEPYLVMLDHNLQETGKSGLDYLRKIRLMHPNTPVLYMSSDNTHNLVEESRRLGATEFISKDYSFIVRLKHVLDTMIHSRDEGFFKRLFHS